MSVYTTGCLPWALNQYPLAGKRGITSRGVSPPARVPGRDPSHPEEVRGPCLLHSPLPPGISSSHLLQFLP